MCGCWLLEVRGVELADRCLICGHNVSTVLSSVSNGFRQDFHIGLRDPEIVHLSATFGAVESEFCPRFEFHYFQYPSKTAIKLILEIGAFAL